MLGSSENAVSAAMASLSLKLGFIKRWWLLLIVSAGFINYISITMWYCGQNGPCGHLKTAPQYLSPAGCRIEKMEKVKDCVF